MKEFFATLVTIVFFAFWATFTGLVAWGLIEIILWIGRH